MGIIRRKPGLQRTDYARPEKRAQKSNGRPRARTETPKRIPKWYAQILSETDLNHPRPKTRFDCTEGEFTARPCVYVGCKWNLYLDQTKPGHIKFNHLNLEPEEMVVSCALDEIDKMPEGMGLKDIADAINLTNEGVALMLYRSATKVIDLLPATENEKYQARKTLHKRTLSNHGVRK